MTAIKNEKGSIIILALWTLMFLGLLSMVFGAVARQQIILVRNLETRSGLYDTAVSGVEFMTDAVVSKKNVDIYSERSVGEYIRARFPNFSGSMKLGEGHFDLAAKTGTSGAFGLTDEGGKININFAAPDILQKLLSLYGGMDTGSALTLAHSIVDWRDADDIRSGCPDGSSEKLKYSRRGYQYVPRNRPFVCVEEVMLVHGMTPGIFVNIRDMITVNGSGKININTVSTEVLHVLGLDMALAEKIIEYRESKRDPFYAPGEIMSVVSGETFSERERYIRQLDNLILSGILGVRVEVFSVVSRSRLDRGGPEGVIFCVFDIGGRILYIGYQIIGGGTL